MLDLSCSSATSVEVPWYSNVVTSMEEWTWLVWETKVSKAGPTWVNIDVLDLAYDDDKKASNGVVNGATPQTNIRMLPSSSIGIVSSCRTRSAECDLYVINLKPSSRSPATQDAVKNSPNLNRLMKFLLRSKAFLSGAHIPHPPFLFDIQHTW